MKNIAKDHEIAAKSKLQFAKCKQEGISIEQ
jgi:hypothetical protein